MNITDLKSALKHEKEIWGKKSYEELKNLNLERPITIERNEAGFWYQVELHRFEETSEYYHLGISVDQGEMIPLTDSIIVREDGTVNIGED